MILPVAGGILGIVIIAAYRAGAVGLWFPIVVLIAVWAVVIATPKRS